MRFVFRIAVILSGLAAFFLGIHGIAQSHMVSDGLHYVSGDIQGNARYMYEQEIRQVTDELREKWGRAATRHIQTMTRDAAAAAGGPSKGPAAHAERARKVYMTMLTPMVNATADDVDWYFRAVRVLVHRLLRHPASRGNHPVVVLIMPGVDKWKVDRLQRDGAITRHIEPLTYNDVAGQSAINMNSEPRWADQFSKLRIFEMTEYELIVYLDADILVMSSLEELFKTPPVANVPKHANYTCAYPSPELFNVTESFQEPAGYSNGVYPYTFAAVTDNGGANHTTPPAMTKDLNAGLLVVSPSKALFDRLLHLGRHPEVYEYARGMEQGLLRSAFRLDGPTPFTPLEWTYNGLWANMRDFPHLRTVHGKFWAVQKEKLAGLLPNRIIVEWWLALGEMEGYWSFAEGSAGLT